MTTHLLGDSVKLTSAQREMLASLGRPDPLRCPRCGEPTYYGRGAVCRWCAAMDAVVRATDRAMRIASARRRERARYCKWQGMEC